MVNDVSVMNEKVLRIVFLKKNIFNFVYGWNIFFVYVLNYLW